MERLWQDIRYGYRMMVKSPGFTAVAVLTLALGIGANTAIFSLINTLMLRPLPVDEPERVVRVDTGRSHTSYPDYQQFQRLNAIFTGLLAHEIAPLNLGEGESLGRVLGDMVTGNYFPLLGVGAQFGRTFATEVDAEPGAHPVVVISDGMWRRKFQADPEIVGKTILLNGQGFTVIGVAPSGFHGTFNFGLAPEVWAPLSMQRALFPGPDRLADRRHVRLEVFGRLKPGISVAQANAAANALGKRLAAEYGSESPRIEYTRVHPVTGIYAFRGIGSRQAIFIFLGLQMTVAGLVLLIACANLANLQLARGLARSREIAVRLALGATRGRLVRQLLTESLVLALVAGAVACLVAVWATDALRAWTPPIPETMEIDLRIDWRVLSYSLGVSLLTGVLFGLLPALRASRVGIVPQLKEGSTGFSGKVRRFGLRDLLVSGQVGVCLVLLVCAGLFVRSLDQARQVDPGFDVDHVLSAELDLKASGYDEVRGQEFLRRLLERIEQIHGVEAATTARMVPLTASRTDFNIAIEGRDYASEQYPSVNSNTIGPRYFEVMGIRVLAGREFTPRDVTGAPPVAIINETAARHFWPGENALGKRIQELRFGPENGPWMEVVGVVKDSKYYSYGEDPRPVLYLPAGQNFDVRAFVHVRTAGPPSQWSVPVRRAVQELDRTMLAEMATLRDQTALGLLPGRIAAGLLGTFGLLGLGLALVGIYGVVSYEVSQRTREMGIRMALGAHRRDLFALVLGGGLRLALAGVTGGSVVALVLTRVLGSLLVGVSPGDPLTYGSVVLMLVSAVVVACYLPARRATRVDPMTALRYE